MPINGVYFGRPVPRPLAGDSVLITNTPPRDAALRGGTVVLSTGYAGSCDYWFNMPGYTLRIDEFKVVG